LIEERTFGSNHEQKLAHFFAVGQFLAKHPMISTAESGVALPRGVVQKLGGWIFNDLHGSISREVRRSVRQIQS
jgi:hypothetical protein